MEKQLAVRQDSAPVLAGTRGVQFGSLSDMLQFAEIAVRSKMVPKTLETPEAALLAIQHGMEIGLSPAQALQSIAVINGRPTVWGDAALALAMAREDFVDINELFEGEGEHLTAVCIVQRKDRAPVKRTFSVKDAKRAQLDTKAGPWTQYPRRMLAMRARAFALRDSFPDALKGIGIREEVDDYHKSEPKPVRGIVLPDEPAPTPETFALEAAE